ncbi:hypothetical protein EWM64_g7255 [Hericium alpestre]|uniref:Uncharacterized protein n=1 Tax=Hericium alpestre TaxID=135208 RepID=A0A4Y9ZRS5_9AGAM|nr:hypothetical protein EWM64_g7255 [Hericium alpestre]
MLPLEDGCNEELRNVAFITDFWPPHWQAHCRSRRQTCAEYYYSTYYYDGLAFVTWHWNWFNMDALGVLHGKYHSQLQAVKIGERAICKSLHEQLGKLKADANILSAYPTIIAGSLSSLSPTADNVRRPEITDAEHWESAYDFLTDSTCVHGIQLAIPRHGHRARSGHLVRVWDIETGYVMWPDYFKMLPLEDRCNKKARDVVFIVDFWHPHWQVYVACAGGTPRGDPVRRAAHVHATTTAQGGGPHWNWFNANTLGVLHVKYCSQLPAVKIGERAIRKSLHEQLDELKADANIVGTYSTIIDEIGIRTTWTSSVHTGGRTAGSTRATTAGSIACSTHRSAPQTARTRSPHVPLALALLPGHQPATDRRRECHAALVLQVREALIRALRLDDDSADPAGVDHVPLLHRHHDHDEWSQAEKEEVL